MTFDQAVEYVGQLADYERKLPHGYDKEIYGIDRIRRLLDHLGRPQDAFASIHVAGTNGKGSTCAMADAILRASGLRCGLFTSPHLTDMRERFVVDGARASEGEFASLATTVRETIASMEDGDLVTFFEVFTALGFLHFARQGVDAAVVEVGMGGRLDSTNVLQPRVCAITPIGLDHTKFLGDTIEEIAAEKAGIIKPSVPVVTTATGGALAVIAARAAALDCPYYALGEAFDAEPEESGTWAISVPGLKIGGATLALRGGHQGANAACAVMAATLLTGGSLESEAVRNGLATVHWPGRFQVIATRPTLVLDGAMNAESARALHAALDSEFPGRPRAFVLGMSSDKSPARMVRELLHGAAAVICTAAASPRAMAPAELAASVAEEARGMATVVAEASGLEVALAIARERAGPEGVVCVTGSLYLVAEALEASQG